MSLGSNGVNRVRSLRKNSDGTSWHEVFHQFDPFYSKCCYATKQSQMHPNNRNTPKYEFRIQWGGSGVFVAKIPTILRGTNFCNSLTRFALSVVWQPKSPKCTQIVGNAPKREFRFQWVGSDAFITKNSDVTSWNELLQQFCPFCTEFCKATK